ncbi:MAG: site-2 protease family protein [Aggregatilineales bacterium]
MLLFSSNPSIEYLIGVILAALVGMTVHEFAHCYVAFLMGDSTAAEQGHLTLDPRVHINPLGFFMFILIGFGTLGQAPVNPYRMRNPRWGYLASVAAGPLSNLGLAIIFGIFIRIIGLQNLVFDFPELISQILLTMVTFNILLFIFNLLPLSPLDGWNIVYTLLPPDLAVEWERNRSNTQMVFFALILFSYFPGFPSILGILIGEPTIAIRRLILGL